jgi:hypothetical protein
MNKMDGMVGMNIEEEKMLQIALKNSLRQTEQSTSVKLNEIEEMKTYRYVNYQNFIASIYI